MVGITSYSVYTPRYRMARAVIAAAWNQRPLPGSKAVTAFDEDSLTMAQAAISRLAESGSHPDALYFASTTSPYWQRSASSMIAAFCDWPAEVSTSDLGGSLRSGSSALRIALDSVAAGSCDIAFVVASDKREGNPESAEELLFGDAAAAIAIGKQNVIAEPLASLSRTDIFLDEWRRDTDAAVQSFPNKYSLSHGYEPNLLALGNALLAKAGVSSKDVSRLAVVSPDGRAHLSVAKALCIGVDRVEDPRVNDIGNAGAAAPLLILANALDHSKPGDLILSLAYGDGAEGFLFRVTEAIQNISRPMRVINRQPIDYSSYALYQKLRSFSLESRGSSDLSNIFLKREENQLVRLRGTRCGGCRLIQYPPASVCIRCHSSQNLSAVPLARRGKVFTFNEDYLYEAPTKPTIVAVVDLEGGGRIVCQITDVAEHEVQIGMEVELVLRRVPESTNMHNYYWKCRPL